MNYLEQSIYDFVVHGIVTPRKSLRCTLGEHLNEEIIRTFESKYSYRVDTTFTHLVNAYGFTADTYRNYYSAYCRLRSSGKVTLEHLLAEPFCFHVEAIDRKIPTTPSEVIDLREQVSRLIKENNQLREQLVEKKYLEKRLDLIVENQKVIQRIIQSAANEKNTKQIEEIRKDKYKETLVDIQCHFHILEGSMVELWRVIKEGYESDMEFKEFVDLMYRKFKNSIDILIALKKKIKEGIGEE
ncbi:MAG: hypothetical protein J6F30_12030 [Cellulosilyticum sp.]|nr:hypothetical protein [Cellulosilyticum sp.]